MVKSDKTTPHQIDDVMDLELSEYSQMTLTHPVTGKPLAGAEPGEVQWLELPHHMSSVYAAEMMKIRREIIEEMAAAKENPADENTPEEEVVPREGQRSLTLYSRLVRNWNVYSKGEKLPLTEENALRFFTKLIWAKVQAEEHVFDTGNFM